MNARNLIAAAVLPLSIFASLTSASNYTVNWMQHAPTPFGSAPPTTGNYFLPGIGNVQMTYALDSDFAEGRLAVGPLGVGSVTNGPDNYSWTSQECFARTNWANSGNLNTSWNVTYTFSNPVPAGSLVVGVQGLGRRDPDMVGVPPSLYMTECSVNQNGTFLGEFTGAMNVGPTQFTSGPGYFSMINSLSGAGGIDPWWNTGLAVVRIDDNLITSLTVRFAQTAGDGVGVNIGSIVPSPASATLLGMGALTMARRRRTR
ncbi:MAG TPA: hypothetical protein VK176_15935 [Phycisphaerales bacterium]|nr:hypothetical protein [Phycisphaerales bacterium]